MPTTVSGIYRDGRVELSEQPPNIACEAQVLVTFLETPGVNLAERGISPADAAELQGRLATFADEWDSSEMSIYDNYDAERRSGPEAHAGA